MDQRTFADSHFAREKIRCVLVDDHALIRHGIRRLLEDERDFEVVAEAADALEALKVVSEHNPDVVLMDVGMPGLSAFEAARRIQRDRPVTKLVFLTMHEDEDYAMQGLQAGAAGYVLKDTPADRLVTALREIHSGGKYVSPEVLNRLVETVRTRPSKASKMSPRAATLTPREREVIKMIAEGRSVKEVANMLGLSVKTVEAHKFNLMRKLRIHNKAQLVTYAIQKKIVNIPAGA